jgi:hypothetical protein
LPVNLIGDAGTGGEASSCIGEPIELDPTCPPDPPEAETPCTTQKCIYTIPHGYESWSCIKGAWRSFGTQVCTEDCSVVDPTAGIALGGCGAGLSRCENTTYGLVTNHERLEYTMHEIALCCGAANSTTISLTFVNGCATRVAASPVTPFNQTVEECIARALEGVQLDCANNQSCVVFQGWDLH